MRIARVYLVVVLFLTGLLVGLPWYAQAQALPKKIPVSVIADKLDYDRTNDMYVAVGHVKIEQEGVRLEADRVVLNNKTGEAVAEGNVYVQDQGQVVHAEKMQLNINTRDGIIIKGDVFMKKENFHLKGDKIERQSETLYHVENGEFTTCDDDEWSIKAREMNINMEKYATGNHVSFKVGGVPMLYSPYFLFPVRRQTGFLIPELGHSSSDGMLVKNSFYWAISDYKDMTIYSDFRERIGHGTGVEYRYMNSRESSGQLYYKYFDLYHTSGSKWEFKLQHKDEFAEDLSARADINLVSDEHYYHDLEKKIDDQSKPYLDSNIFYVERWDTASLYLMGQYSIDLTTTNENTVQKLPELRYTIYDETIAGPLHLSFEGSAANFTKQDQDGARRVDFNPRLTASFGSNGLSLTPRAGVRATFYDRSADTLEPTERKYFYAGADVNGRISRVFSKDTESGIGRIRHSIEPTLSYTYIPQVDQGNIPQFDSVDSVSAQNTVSFALTNRFTAHYKQSKEAVNYTTFDLMVLRVSQSYDLNIARDKDLETGRPRSEVLGELYVKTPEKFSASATGSYNTYDHVLSSHSESIGLAMSAVSLSLSHSYTRGDPGTEYLITSGTLKLGKWKLGTQWWRDMENKETTEEDYSLYYASQCWGVGLTYTDKPGETKFMVLLDLKSLGGKGLGK